MHCCVFKCVCLVFLGGWHGIMRVVSFAEEVCCYMSSWTNSCLCFLSGGVMDLQHSLSWRVVLLLPLSKAFSFHHLAQTFWKPWKKSKDFSAFCVLESSQQQFAVANSHLPAELRCWLIFPVVNVQEPLGPLQIWHRFWILMDIALGMAVMWYKSSLYVVWREGAIHIHSTRCGWRWIVVPLLVLLAYTMQSISKPTALRVHTDEYKTSFITSLVTSLAAVQCHVVSSQCQCASLMKSLCTWSPGQLCFWKLVWSMDPSKISPW